MRIRLDRFPQGVTKAVTLSYDDGKAHDRRLVHILNEHGLKASFHLNSGFFGKEGYISASEVKSLFHGHEVSAHTVDHPFLEQSPSDQIVRELSMDREALETLVGYPVRGMSYPFGSYSERVLSHLPGLGIEYARTTASHGGFHMPSDFLQWHPTCHHKQMLEQADAFLALQQRFSRMALLYVWGHSYEFEDDNNWEIMEQFGAKFKGRDDIWFATNAEIVAYMKAVESLRFSANCKIIHNPSAVSVWLSAEGETVEVPAGQIVQL
ncbi:polysaccharide deacetylase family protein [Paenibacillus roseipurpureus]|uniref:Polysaccharide deacetylase family protein n=1 Tax=Paenibacillus roseopurpureus TaxID=2918901 RepID=A0AA96LMX1_9BACL|nr:polysaccharide deacetylase family protein [Paenibacillus sp. MBLB1832]WNR42658.1 polysaccharide deacetylase family protein [Paenibacillus sp. MBLB1832]